MAQPTRKTEKIAKDWQEKERNRRGRIEEKERKRAEQKQAEMKAKTEPIDSEERPEEKGSESKTLTNQEIADTLEFQEWCRDRGIEPTRRQAAKNRGEYLQSLELEENTQKKAA